MFEVKSNEWTVTIRYEEQACGEPPPSALNMTLPAFAAWRRRLPLSVNICFSCRRSAANPPLLSIHGTDERTFDRYITLLRIPCGQRQ